MITDAELSIFSKSVCACTFIGSFSVSAKSFCITAVDVRGTLVYILSKKNGLYFSNAKFHLTKR